MKAADQRGYLGGEKNRVLTPEQVIWARGVIFRREMSAAEVARLWGMGVESVRRMARGETYQNVGEALPQERSEIGKSSYGAQDGVEERALEALKASGILEAVQKEGEGDLAKEGDDAVEKFLRGSEGEDDPFRQE